VIPIPFAEQDLSQGLIQDTADPANFAIDGPGYFVVSGPSGQQLTRSGSFRLDSSGRLVTMEGRAVLGRNGPIQIASADWSVDSGGNVQVNGLVVDALRIEPGTNGRAASGASQRGNVIQGRLESSNVSVVKEMVLMLTALRAYEANQRTIQAFDQTLDKIINLPGRNA
jgi:flagellar basal-body rod protein FlgG